MHEIIGSNPNATIVYKKRTSIYSALLCSIHSKKERGGSFNCQIKNKILMRLYSVNTCTSFSLFFFHSMKDANFGCPLSSWLKLLSIWDVGLWDFLSCYPDQWLLFVIYFIHFFMLIRILDSIINQSFISFKISCI